MNKIANALQVLVLTPHIHAHLKERDPKALEQSITALRDSLPKVELEQFEKRLAHYFSSSEKPCDEAQSNKFSRSAFTSFAEDVARKVEAFLTTNNAR